MTTILCLSSCMTAAWGAHLDLDSPAFGAHGLFHVSLTIPTKAIPFPLSYPSASMLFRRLFSD